MKSTDIVPGKWYKINASVATTKNVLDARWRTPSWDECLFWGKAIGESRKGWWNFEVQTHRGSKTNFDTTIQEHSCKSVERTLRRSDAGIQDNPDGLLIPVDPNSEVYKEWKQKLFDEELAAQVEQERVDQLETKLDFISSQLAKFGVNISHTYSNYAKQFSVNIYSKFKDEESLKVLDALWNIAVNQNVDSEYKFDIQ